MNDKDIESRLASALNTAAPDMLDDLMSELGINEAPEPSMKERLAEDTQKEFRSAKVRRRNLRTLISCAAALIVMIGIVSVWRNMDQTVLATVDLDVNPGIELAINAKEKVIGAKAVNEEGEAILAEMDLKGSDVRTACNAIVGAMLMKGYLNDRSNSILLSVCSDDSSRSREIEDKLSGYINEYMGESNFGASIMGQCVDSDDELRAFADKNGISPGKAWLIRKVLATGGAKMTEDSLLGLSTQELIVLGQERNVQSETVYGKADTGSYISHDEALDAALRHAGIDRSQISAAEIEMDCEKGIIIYEVEFDCDGYEYEYEIDASTGELISSEKESYAEDHDDDDDDDADDDDD